MPNRRFRSREGGAGGLQQSCVLMQWHLHVEIDCIMPLPCHECLVCYGACRTGAVQAMGEGPWGVGVHMRIEMCLTTCWGQHLL